MIFLNCRLLYLFLKGLKVDVANKQLTVEFVNQSAMNSSSRDLDGSFDQDSGIHSNSRLEFAERLGVMNRQVLALFPNGSYVFLFFAEFFNQSAINSSSRDLNRR